MNLEIHTKTSLFKPLDVNWLLNINGQYFAISKNIPKHLDKFMILVKDYKQWCFLGVYFRAWKRIAELQEYK
jgi:hypothetical protein